MIKYAEEVLTEIREEIDPIIEFHYEELAMYKDKIELCPDWAKYKQLEEAGMLKTYTVRDEEMLVGYYIVIVSTSLHYSKDLFGCNDIVLIKPEYRKAKIGAELFQFVEEDLKRLGVSVMTMHMKTFLPFDKLCEGLGWDYAERLYTKCIKGN